MASSSAHLRLDRGEFGGTEPFLYAHAIGGDPLGDGPSVARPVGGCRGDAFPGQCGQLGIGPAGFEPGVRRGNFSRAARRSVSSRVLPTNAGEPVKISQRIEPRAKT